MKEIRINANGLTIPTVNPEHLILRFANELQFNGDTMRVANDAVRIVQRMSRDWMTPGRRPSGICGAALIVAARMNNHRRTPREISHLVKVHSITINDRLDEFKLVESADLTVENFRNMFLETEADPPAYTRNQEGKKKGRKRRRKEVEYGDDGDDYGIETTPSILARQAQMTPQATAGARETTPAQVPTPSPTQQQALDSQRMPPPPIPIDPTLQQAGETRSETASTSGSRTSPASRKGVQTRSRKRKSAAVEEPSEDDQSHPGAPPGLEIPNTPTSQRSKPKKARGRPSKAAQAKNTDQTPTGDQRYNAESTKALTDPFNASLSALGASEDVTLGHDPGQSHDAGAGSQPRREISTSTDIGEDEFADDPEVQNCLLNEDEVRLKTQIWTDVNQDWLREKSAKEYKQKLEEENGTGPRKKQRTRKRRRMGDLSQYKEHLGPDWERRIESGEVLAPDTAKAVEMMLKERGYARGKQFSAKINYEKIKDLYTPSSSSRRTSVVEGASPENQGQTTPLPSNTDGDAGLGVSEPTDNAGERRSEVSGSIQDLDIEDDGAPPPQDVTDEPTVGDTAGEDAQGTEAQGEQPAQQEESEDEYFDNEAAARRLAERQANGEADDDDEDEDDDEDGDDGSDRYEDVSTKHYDDDDPYEAVGAESE